ncbi:hypothetical protein DY000_02041434 [Brassica cretica]|uniref:DUF4005 domain-containing protein n=1 Tax=Brassica cretica TaxID=69181 RepID=A0ABQ7BM59_BRACR|nr:hypothetical protein DY000_02041434 [Brassica cretica]
MGATYDTRSRRNEGSAISCSGVRHPLRTNTPSTSLENGSNQDRARSVARMQKEEMKLVFRVTSRSGVRHPLRAQPLVNNFQEVERPWGARSATRAQKRRNEAGIQSDVSRRGEALALEAERPGGATSHTLTRFSYSDRKFMFYLGLSGC